MTGHEAAWLTHQDRLADMPAPPAGAMIWAGRAEPPAELGRAGDFYFCDEPRSWWVKGEEGWRVDEARTAWSAVDVVLRSQLGTERRA